MKNTKNKNFIEYENRIVEATIRLMSKDKLHYPTVVEIIKQANITRPTFYLHFTSVEEVYELIGHKVTDKLMSVINEYKGDYLNHMLDILLSYCKAITKDLTTYRCLARSSRAADFVYYSSKNVADHLAKSVYLLNDKLNKSKEVKKLLWTNYFQIVHMHLTSIVASLKGDIDVPLEQLSYQLVNNSYKVYNSLWRSIGIVIKERDYLNEYQSKQQKISA